MAQRGLETGTWFFPVLRTPAEGEDARHDGAPDAELDEQWLVCARGK